MRVTSGVYARWSQCTCSLIAAGGAPYIQRLTFFNINSAAHTRETRNTSMEHTFAKKRVDPL
ncbi:hypothetical protein HMPREF3190_01256 [Umbribacter vaginalis]|nr:hypothetical protein HMPREF3190_01256 [Coriobacteriales bacterium DNF00809]